MSTFTTRLVPSISARLAALSLDRQLAQGCEPTLTPALARRAAILGSRRARRRTAAGLRRVLAEAPGRGTLSAAVACDRAAVELARPALEQLERVLRERPTHEPRGLALATLLLSDPESVLYQAPQPDRLYEAARQALLALSPRGGTHAAADRPAAREAVKVG